MTSDLLQVALGFALLVLGGEFLVRGAAALAARWGVPPLVIGLTVVAFGTSAPELVVSVTAVLNDRPAIALGNVFGSNSANIGLILGTCALAAPLSVEISLVRREIPILILISLASGVMIANGSVGRLAGAALLIAFVVYLAFTLSAALRSKATVEIAEAAGRGRSPAWLGAQIVVGLACLIGGSEIAVDASVSLARSLGISEAVIGVSLVAVATSLPEFVTSIVATVRGQADVAVGNVVGSNIFNLLFILGTSAAVSPTEIPVPEGGLVDVWAAAAFACLLLPLASSHKFRLVRWEGALLLAAYVGLMIFRFQ